MLVDTCTKGGTVGRLAERRLVLDQPVEEIRRHGHGESAYATATQEPLLARLPGECLFAAQ